MSLSQIGQIALPVSDANQSEKFYEEALGMRKLFRYGDIVFFDCAGVRLMLEGSPKKIEAVASCLYFKVDHIESAVSEMKAKEVKFEDEPHLIAKMPDHELWMTFFRDPDGHPLGLMEERK